MSDLAPRAPVPTLAERFFWGVTEYPRTVLALCLLAMLAMLSFIPSLRKDARTEAFIPQTHPSVLDRDRVKEIFRLRDPIVIAVLNGGEHGIFTPETLALVQNLTDELAKIPGIDPDRIKSLATEKNIYSSQDGMNVEPFYRSVPDSPEAAESIRKAVMGFPLYVGSLVARNGSATAIAAELLSDADGQQVYKDVLELTRRIPTHGEQLHVAGEAAVSGYLGHYMDRDAMILTPLCTVIIAAILFFAYRTGIGLLLPGLIVLGAVAAAVGGSAAAHVPFYVVTNAIPPIMIAVGVGDVLHILGDYYEEYAREPEATGRELAVRCMTDIWRAIVLTRMTDVVGFLALAATSSMPPLQAVGVFCSVGVFAAMVFSMLITPALLTLARPKLSPALRFLVRRGQSTDLAARLMAALGRFVMRRPGWIVAVGGVLAAFGIQGTLLLRLNESRIENFHHHEPIYLADQAINSTLDGTTHVDVLIETNEHEALLKPENLRRIEALQAHAATLPHVRSSSSIVDYLKQINRSANEDRPERYAVPESSDAAAQYLLLYSSIADPSDFDDVADFDYRLANVRIVLDSGLYTDERVVVEDLDTYVKTRFNSEGVTAKVTGRATVDYYWVGGIGSSYWQGIVASLLGVWIMVAIPYRSAIAGFCALIPVALSILLIHAVMGITGIWLGVGASMSADIAIGVGVDFGIHTMERLSHLVGKGYDMKTAMERLFPSTGRTLLFMFMALVLGVSATLISAVPSIVRFGALFCGALVVTFVSSLTLLPAVLQLLQPRFLCAETSAAGPSGLRAASLVLAGLLIWGSPMAVRAQQPVGGAAPAAAAAGLPEGIEIAKKINARNEGSQVARTINIELTDKPGGSPRSRKIRGFRKAFGDERRLVLFYQEPKNISGTAFLTHDHPERGRDDDQWLFLPSDGKARRLASADRGRYFTETDFTYDDLTRDTKVNIDDYTWKTLGQEKFDGKPCYVLESTPVDQATAKDLGYGKVVSRVDAEIWMIRQVDYFDVAGNPLKSFHASEIRQDQGVWTPHKLEMENKKTGHKTVFSVTDVNYQASVPEDMFEQRTLNRGPR